MKQNILKTIIALVFSAIIVLFANNSINVSRVHAADDPVGSQEENEATPEPTVKPMPTIDPQAEPVKILFIGNSHTYFNNMPKMYEKFCEADGIKTYIESIAVNGYPLYKYASLDDPYGVQVYNALTTKKWDYVVVQENRKKIVEKVSSGENAVNTLHKLIEMSGAKMIMYAPHSDRYNNMFTLEGMSMYLTNYQISQAVSKYNYYIANQYEGLIADYCTNCRRTLVDFPTINMYNSDMIHPTIRGSYLAVCSIYQTMFDKSPIGNAYMPDSLLAADNSLKGLTVTQAETLQRIADTKLKMDSFYMLIKKGDVGKIGAKIISSEGNEILDDYRNEITYRSDNNSNVSVNYKTGEFTALKPGKHLVSAETDSGLVAYTLLDVKQPSTVFYLEDVSLTTKVFLGDKVKISKYNIEPADTTDTVSWSSDNPASATVDQNGEITSTGIGVAKITASTTSGLSDRIYIRTMLKAPTKLKVKNVTKKPKKKKKINLKVSWKAVTGATGYVIYRKTDKQKSFKKYKTVTTTTFTDKKLKKKRGFTYKVKATFTDSKSNSAFCEPVSYQYVNKK